MGALGRAPHHNRSTASAGGSSSLQHGAPHQVRRRKCFLGVEGAEGLQTIPSIHIPLAHSQISSQRPNLGQAGREGVMGLLVTLAKLVFIHFLTGICLLAEPFVHLTRLGD